jgi:hypothetical protein
MGGGSSGGGGGRRGWQTNETNTKIASRTYPVQDQRKLRLNYGQQALFASNFGQPIGQQRRELELQTAVIVVDDLHLVRLGVGERVDIDDVIGFFLQGGRRPGRQRR